MRKNHWVCLGLLCNLVGCSGSDSSPALGPSGAAGIGGTPGSGATSPAGGTAGAAPGAGGQLTSSGGALSAGGAIAAGGGGAIGGAISAGGVSAGSGGASGAMGGSAGAGTGGAGAAAGGGAGAAAGGSPPVSCMSPMVPADQFKPDTKTGGGGTQFKDSTHFRIYGSAPSTTIDTTLKHVEAAYSCFIDDWCFRTTSLPVKTTSGPYYKMNIYASGSLGSAAGLTQLDMSTGLPYVQAISSQMDQPRVTVHEWGHAVTISEYNWVDQTNTGAWWETVANWFADTYQTSTYCDAARARIGTTAGGTLIDLNRVIGQSYLLIVSTQNYYEAWPFLTYLTMNPDNYPGLGKNAVQDMMRKHMRNNETPLHVLERMTAPVKVQTVLGHYWAHMAFLDIGHPKAQEAFKSARSSLNYANLDSMGGGMYQVKAGRQPQYGGANIIPLKGTGDVTVQIKNLGNGRPESNFTATLAIRADSGAVRYVDLPNGAGQATIASNEEATLVVVNTPDMLYMYNAFNTTATSPESIGLNYQVQITGPAPAN